MYNVLLTVKTFKNAREGLVQIGNQEPKLRLTFLNEILEFLAKTYNRKNEHVQATHRASKIMQLL